MYESVSKNSQRDYREVVLSQREISRRMFNKPKGETHGTGRKTGILDNIVLYIME